MFLLPFCFVFVAKRNLFARFNCNNSLYVYSIFKFNCILVYILYYLVIDERYIIDFNNILYYFLYFTHLIML